MAMSSQLSKTSTASVPNVLRSKCGTKNIAQPRAVVPNLEYAYPQGYEINHKGYA